MLQSLLFLLIGLDFRYILERISSIPVENLLLYGISIILVVVIGRFIWVYPAAFLPRYFFLSIRKKDPYPPWQYLFIISWAGMRGGISLAAALAIPALSVTIDGANANDLVIFLVFCVIVATLLIQGLTLPWILSLLGIHQYGKHEKYHEHLSELKARIKMSQDVIQWLSHYHVKSKGKTKLCNEIKFHIRDYQKINKDLKERLSEHDQTENHMTHNENIEIKETLFLETQIVDIQRKSLAELWRHNKVTLSVRNKLIQELDYRFKQINT
jgi:CPA1 family monovalent cation:H+ antiporter